MSNNKIPFRTAYDHQHERNVPYAVYISPSGSAYKNEYGYEIDKFGRKILVKTGESNLYELIQESLEETKIENILKRYAAGDTSVMRPDGIYADISTAPNNLIEARQQMQKIENAWQELDIEIRRKYNFDLDTFIAEAGSEHWLKDMGLLKIQEEITPETIKQEQEAKDE